MASDTNRRWSQLRRKLRRAKLHLKDAKAEGLFLPEIGRWEASRNRDIERACKIYKLVPAAKLQDLEVRQRRSIEHGLRAERVKGENSRLKAENSQLKAALERSRLGLDVLRREAVSVGGVNCFKQCSQAVRLLADNLREPKRTQLKKLSEFSDTVAENHEKFRVKVRDCKVDPFFVCKANESKLSFDTSLHNQLVRQVVVSTRAWPGYLGLETLSGPPPSGPWESQEIQREGYDRVFWTPDTDIDAVPINYYGVLHYMREHSSLSAIGSQFLRNLYEDIRREVPNAVRDPPTDQIRRLLGDRGFYRELPKPSSRRLDHAYSCVALSRTNYYATHMGILFLCGALSRYSRAGAIGLTAPLSAYFQYTDEMATDSEYSAASILLNSAVGLLSGYAAKRAPGTSNLLGKLISKWF